MEKIAPVGAKATPARVKIELMRSALIDLQNEARRLGQRDRVTLLAIACVALDDEAMARLYKAVVA